MKDLRDTFACQLLQRGVPLTRVSSMLGHAEIAITSKHYVSAIPDDEDVDPARREIGEVWPDLLASGDVPTDVPTASPRKGGTRK